MATEYSLILFDMDGTLFDFKKAELEAFSKTFIDLGKPEIVKKHSIFEEKNLKLWHQLEKGEIAADILRIKRFKDFFDEIGSKLDAKKVSEIYISNLKEQSYLINYAETILEWLKNNKITTSIITNGLSDVQYRRIEKSGVKGYFDNIFISEEIGYSKPNKKFFDFVINSYPHIKKSKILIVGDSLTSDIKGAINCGIDSVWFNPKKLNQNLLNPKFEITTLLELKDIIKKPEK